MLVSVPLPTHSTLGRRGCSPRSLFEGVLNRQGHCPVSKHAGAGIRTGAAPGAISPAQPWETRPQGWVLLRCLQGNDHTPQGFESRRC